MQKLFISLGSLNALIAVAAGAFATHGLKDSLSEHYLDIFKTASEYQFYHGLGLLIIGILLNNEDNLSTRVSGWIMLTGILLFSGSLYALALTEIRWLGIITPVGGTCFLIAWLTLTVSFLKSGHTR